MPVVVWGDMCVDECQFVWCESIGCGFDDSFGVCVFVVVVCVFVVFFDVFVVGLCFCDGVVKVGYGFGIFFCLCYGIVILFCWFVVVYI